MRRKVAAVWISLVIMVSSIVILVEIAERVEAPTTLYVGGAGGGNYSKIQWAIDNASGGDTVFVYNGTYYENIIISKSINITGENRNITMIDGGGNGDVVFVNSSWVNITGFTLKNSGNIGSPNFDSGIEINNVHNCIIIQNNLSYNYYGINLRYADKNTIMNNDIISSSNVGLVISNSKENYVMSNNISLSNQHGIFSGGTSYGNEIIQNSITSNRIYGIIISYGNDDNITKNNVSRNKKYGIYLRYSERIIIKENLVSFNTEYGIYLYSTNESKIINNTSLNNQHGIHLDWYSEDNSIIANNANSNTDHGIYCYISNRILIIGNNATSNGMNGIYLENSHDNTVLNNKAYLNTRTGIYLTRADRNIITENNVLFNDEGGIRMGYSTMNEIIMNNASFNDNYGINVGYLEGNTISGNNASSNNYFGITIVSSDGVVIKNNTVFSNDYEGIRIDSSSNFNYVYHNRIIQNIVQATDEGNNQWDNGYPYGGNYWFDYVGNDHYKGPNQNIPGYDDIGDTPYVIDANSLDNYPLIGYYKPLENYTILKNGWNLISIPLIQNEQNLTRVLGSIDSWYDAVQWYDPIDPTDPWKHNKITKPLGNDLNVLNETISFWIHITQPGDTIFLYNGTQPLANQTIQLYEGWNMVGYPSLTNHNRTVGLNNLELGIDVDCIQWYDAASKTWHFMGPEDSFVPGRGYWVHSKVEVVWEVPL